MFITFEGIEGSGKSTQCRLLKTWLEQKGYKVLLTREPGGTDLGKQIRSILLDKANQELTGESELFLYLADRSLHVSQLILPALKDGTVVICDRFTDSTLVYQGYGRGLDLNLLDSLNQTATSGIKPDITFLLDLPVETGISRALNRNSNSHFENDEGRLEAEEIQFHQKIRTGYLQWANQHPTRFQILDANCSASEIAANVQAVISERRSISQGQRLQPI